MSDRQDTRLGVFISSTMTELRDVRDILSHELRGRGLNAWVYEKSAGARPSSVEATSLTEVEAADVYVGIFAEKYGAVTVQEFTHARALGKPCFVYIRDRNATRDPELVSFLDREVFSLKSGVTYEFFDSAVNLARQVADDVMRWLVDRHRETTAQLAEAEASKIEKERLAAELEKLRAFSQLPLPSGTSVDLLAQQLRGWFTALGYGMERGETREDRYFEWIISVPTRRGYDRIVVRGVDGEIQLADIEAIDAAMEERRADEGWVVAARRISPAARAYAETKKQNSLYCYTLDTLVDEHADFSGYFNWLDAEVKKRRIHEMYIPLSARREEYLPNSLHPAGHSTYGADEGYLDGYIDRWLDDPSKEHVSILGEFGTGKTWFAIHYAWNAMNRYLDARARGVDRPRIPLYVPLRDYAKAISVESLFSEFFFRRYEIPLPGYSVFEQLNRMGKLLLIFDGFDEMAAKIDRQAMIDNFWELAKVVTPGSKVILTSRTEHFPTNQESRSLLRAELKASTSALTGVPPQFEVVELEKLSDDQVELMLRLRASDVVVDLILKDSNLLDLARRPVMTELIVEAIPDIEAGKKLDISRIYLYAVQRKMTRDILDERTFTSLADKLFFLCELSWEMLSTDQMTINYREFPERIREFFGSVVKEEKDVDHWRYDMMGQTMLIRSADGDYTPAHRSLLEFFVAYKFAAELGVLAADFQAVASKVRRVDVSVAPREYTWREFFEQAAQSTREHSALAPLQNFKAEPLDTLRRTVGDRPFSRAIVDLIRNMVEPDETKLKERMFQTLEASRGKPHSETGYTASNLLSALPFPHRAHFFVDADLSELFLASAQLRYYGFKGCDFRESDLSGADLESADMRETKVDGTKFSEAQIRGLGWLTGLSLRNGAEIKFLYHHLPQEENEWKAFRPIQSGTIVMCRYDEEARWTRILQGEEIAAQATAEDGSIIYLLMEDGRALAFAVDNGADRPIPSNAPIFRWANTDASNAQGLNSEQAHFIRISGGRA